MAKAKPCVAVDIDGTLVRTATTDNAHSRALRKAIEELRGGAAVVAINEINFRGSTDRRILRDLLAASDLAPADEAELAELEARSQQLYLRGSGHPAPTQLPGARELVAAVEASEATPTLLTGNFEAIAYRKLELAGLQGTFRIGAFGTALDRSDLLPQLWKRLPTQERVPTIIVGDTPSDIAAGLVYDVPTVAIASGHYDRHSLRLAGAAFVFDDLPSALEHSDAWLP